MKRKTHTRPRAATIQTPERLAKSLLDLDPMFQKHRDDALIEDYTVRIFTACIGKVSTTDAEGRPGTTFMFPSEVACISAATKLVKVLREVQKTSNQPAAPVEPAQAANG